MPSRGPPQPLRRQPRGRSSLLRWCLLSRRSEMGNVPLVPLAPLVCRILISRRNGRNVRTPHIPGVVQTRWGRKHVMDRLILRAIRLILHCRIKVVGHVEVLKPVSLAHILELRSAASEHPSPKLPAPFLEVQHNAVRNTRKSALNLKTRKKK